MPHAGRDFLACRYLPEFDRLVLTTRSHNLAVGAETDARDLVLMPRQGMTCLVSLLNPQVDNSTRKHATTRRSQGLTVGAKTDEIDRVLMPHAGRDFLACRYLPEFD